MTKAKKEVQVNIPGMDIRNMEILLIGDSPLIQHRWSDKARKQMLDKQMKVPKQSKTAKDPAEDFCQSVYIVDEKPGDRKKVKEGKFKGVQFGFPAIAFKAAAVGACRYADGVKMTQARGAFHINQELVELETDGPVLREDMVRIAMGTSDIRYRGEFKKWRARIKIRYNASALSVGQIVSLFNGAGFGVGVGEWRPEKDGSFGMFHVATEGEG